MKKEKKRMKKKSKRPMRAILEPGDTVTIEPVSLGHFKIT
jgi:hypothetical protein